MPILQTLLGPTMPLKSNGDSLTQAVERKDPKEHVDSAPILVRMYTGTLDAEWLTAKQAVIGEIEIIEVDAANWSQFGLFRPSNGVDAVELYPDGLKGGSCYSYGGTLTAERLLNFVQDRKRYSYKNPTRPDHWKIQQELDRKAPILVWLYDARRPCEGWKGVRSGVAQKIKILEVEYCDMEHYDLCQELRGPNELRLYQDGLGYGYIPYVGVMTVDSISSTIHYWETHSREYRAGAYKRVALDKKTETPPQRGLAIPPAMSYKADALETSARISKPTLAPASHPDYHLNKLLEVTASDLQSMTEERDFLREKLKDALKVRDTMYEQLGEASRIISEMEKSASKTVSEKKWVALKKENANLTAELEARKKADDSSHCVLLDKHEYSYLKESLQDLEAMKDLTTKFADSQALLARTESQRDEAYKRLNASRKAHSDMLKHNAEGLEQGPVDKVYAQHLEAIATVLRTTKPFNLLADEAETILAERDRLWTEASDLRKTLAQEREAFQTKLKEVSNDLQRCQDLYSRIGEVQSQMDQAKKDAEAEKNIVNNIALLFPKVPIEMLDLRVKDLKACYKDLRRQLDAAAEDARDRMPTVVNKYDREVDELKAQATKVHLSEAELFLKALAIIPALQNNFQYQALVFLVKAFVSDETESLLLTTDSLGTKGGPTKT